MFGRRPNFIFLSKKRPRPVATGPGCKKVAPRLHYFPNIMKYFGRSRSCGQNKVLVESWRAFLVIISTVRSSSVRLRFWLRRQLGFFFSVSGHPEDITGEQWNLEQIPVPQQDEGESCGYRMLAK